MTSKTPRIDALSAGQNPVINGDFDIWQRGIGPTNVTVGYSQYLADRWCLGKDTTPSTATQSQSTVVPTLEQSGHQSRFSLLVTGNASPSSPAAGDALFINHRIEGNDYRELHGKPVRVQFWVRSSVAGTYSFLVHNKVPGANMRVYATTYTIVATNTWEKKTIDLTLDNTGVWNFDNSIGLNLHWTLTSGASVSTSTLNAWQTSGSQVSGSTGQVNWTNNVSPTFYLSQVSIIPRESTWSTYIDLPFKRSGKTIQQELAMCQRYFYYPNFDGTDVSSAAGHGFAQTTSVARCIIQHPVPMRAQPVLAGDSSNSIAYLATTTPVTSMTIADFGPQATTLSVNTAAVLTAGHGVHLRKNGATGFIWLSAEL